MRDEVRRHVEGVTQLAIALDTLHQGEENLEPFGIGQRLELRGQLLHIHFLGNRSALHWRFGT